MSNPKCSVVISWLGAVTTWTLHEVQSGISIIVGILTTIYTTLRIVSWVQAYRSKSPKRKKQVCEND